MENTDQWDYTQDDLIEFEEYIKILSISIIELEEKLVDGQISEESIIFGTRIKDKLDTIFTNTGKRLRSFSDVEKSISTFDDLFRLYYRLATTDQELKTITMHMYVDFAFEKYPQIIFFLEKNFNHFSDFLYEKVKGIDEFHNYTAIELEHLLKIISEYPELLEKITFVFYDK